MKQIIISIFFLLSIPFIVIYPSYAQEEKTGISYEEYKEQETATQEEEKTTLEEIVSERTETNTFPELNIFQILLAIAAPVSFLVIAYFLIKKFKL